MAKTLPIYIQHWLASIAQKYIHNQVLVSYYDQVHELICWSETSKEGKGLANYFYIKLVSIVYMYRAHSIHLGGFSAMRSRPGRSCFWLLNIILFQLTLKT